MFDILYLFNNTKCIKILSLLIKIFYCLDPHFWNVNFRRASTCSVLLIVISSNTQSIVGAEEATVMSGVQ